ncbi:MAG: hypothetical protein CL878_14480 [Dehalococcoidia bacterium]|nr:hypothetical protein [Dehalococcoidia bacterium]
MFYTPDNAEQWVAWFMDPAQTDEAALKQALDSVRPTHWTAVYLRLNEALFAAHAVLRPPARTYTTGQAVRWWTWPPDFRERRYALELKAALLHAERGKRIGSPPGR